MAQDVLGARPRSCDITSSYIPLSRTLSHGTCRGAWEIRLRVGHIVGAKEVRAGFAMGRELDAVIRQGAKFQLHS